MNSPEPGGLVRTADGLDDALAILQDADWWAVDTEFQRESTYFAVPCLIQVGDGRHAFAFDALSLDLSPLWPLLLDPARLKLMHSADQDHEIFVQEAGDAPAPLFDTQVAATLLGIGDQIGYAGLVEARLGLTVDKSLSRTDWTRRPLSDAAVTYALDDVVHLAAIYPALRDELETAGRLDWLQQDCAELCHAERYRPDPSTAWKRLKGLGRLAPADQQVAARLAHWREELAVSSNRPRRWILKDEVVLAVAQRRPADDRGLEPLGVGQHGSRVRRSLAERIADGLYDDLPNQALASGERPDPEQKQRQSALAARCRQRGEELNIPPSYLAPRADLAALLEHGDNAELRVLRGWRRELVGEDLLALRERLLG